MQINKRLFFSVIMSIYSWVSASPSIDINIGASQDSSVTSVTTASTSTANANELILVGCSTSKLSAETELIPTSTAGLTFSTVTISTGGKGFAGWWAACTNSTLSNVTFTCNWTPGCEGSINVVSLTGTGCTPSTPLGGIGASNNCTGASGTTASCSYNSTIANSLGFGNGVDNDGIDASLSAGAGQNMLHSYTFSSGNSGSAWYVVQQSVTATPGTQVTMSATNVTSSGADMSHTAIEVVPDSIPILSAVPVNNITFNSAQANGNITSDGGHSVTDRGLCWNTTGNPTTSDNCVSVGTGIGTFSTTFSGFSSGSLIYVRAYGTNSLGTGYAPQTMFNTLSYARGNYGFGMKTRSSRWIR